MKINFQHKDKNYEADLSQPLDISLPLKEGMESVNCFYAPFMSTSPVVAGDFIGSTEKGGPLNFLNVKFNPHGNGTHTECVGHIAKEKFTINQCLKEFWFLAEVISVIPMKEGEDRIIKKESFENFCEHLGDVDAIAIRTLPNDDLKRRTNYSGSNPVYVEESATKYLVENRIRHLLIDLPSVDREEDGGALLSHKAFWRYPENPRTDCTITELIYIPDSIKDGLYLLNVQIASFEIDASPSKPILYEIQETA